MKPMSSFLWSWVKLSRFQSGNKSRKSLKKFIFTFSRAWWRGAQKRLEMILAPCTANYFLYGSFSTFSCLFSSYLVSNMLRSAAMRVLLAYPFSSQVGPVILLFTLRCPFLLTRSSTRLQSWVLVPTTFLHPWFSINVSNWLCWTFKNVPEITESKIRSNLGLPYNGVNLSSYLCEG